MSDRPLRLDALLPAGFTPDDMYVMVFGMAAFICIWTLIGSFSNKDQFAGKIKHIQARREDLQREFSNTQQRKKQERSIDAISGIAQKLQLVKKNQIGKTQKMLVQAGLRSKDAIYVLAFFNLLLPIVLFVLGFTIMRLNSDVSPKWQTMNYIWPVLGAYMGLKLPHMYVGRAKKKRNARVLRSLSDVLDLMTICAEAGLSLVAMLDRVSRELRITYPEMAEELSLTSIEIGFLPDRSMALTNLSERCDLPEIRGITSVLIQTEKYGTPIAQALRVLGAEYREARMLRAEQKAARLPALMTVPMIVCILPTLFIVIIAPAVIGVLNVTAKNPH